MDFCAFTSSELLGHLRSGDRRQLRATSIVMRIECDILPADPVEPLLLVRPFL